MSRVFSDRKIHLVATALLVVFYIALSFFVFAWVQTHGDNLKNIQPSYWRKMMAVASASTIVVAIFGSLVVFTGIYYLMKINDASEYYKTLNLVTGILLILGGMVFGLLLTIYLMFND